jgi:hypothetical protein
LGGRGETARKIYAALDASGVEFIDENGGGPGVGPRKQSPQEGKAAAREVVDRTFRSIQLEFIG